MAVAEYGRHLREDVGTGTSSARERAVYQVAMELEAVLDLRDAHVRSAIGLRGGARRFLDREVARATARFLRRTTSAEGLLVPSVAFLDDPSRWNLVLFLEQLPQDLSRFMTASLYRTIRISP